MLLIGSHVGMSGKEMFLGSVKEALSYHANTFMVYTGAPRQLPEILRLSDMYDGLGGGGSRDQSSAEYWSGKYCGSIYPFLRNIR